MAAYQPARVILFGSQARGDAGPDSDVDLLVVFDDDRDRRERRIGIRRLLRDMPFAKDVLVASAADLGHSTGGTAIGGAMRDGVVVYERWLSDDRERDALTWLGFALGDLEAARSQPGRHVRPRIVAFNAQQAAEKALKAALTLSGIDTPKTHDLDDLRRRLPYGEIVSLVIVATLLVTAWRFRRGEPAA